MGGPFLRAPKQVKAPRNKIHKVTLTKLIEGTKWGVGGGCGFLKSNAKRESVASLTKKKSRRVPIDDAKKSFIDHA